MMIWKTWHRRVPRAAFVREQLDPTSFGLWTCNGLDSDFLDVSHQLQMVMICGVIFYEVDAMMDGLIPSTAKAWRSSSCEHTGFLPRCTAGTCATGRQGQGMAKAQ